MKNRTITFVLVRCLRYFNKESVIRIETTPFSSKAASELLEKNGFVKNHNDWWHNGFVFVRVLNDCVEFKTIDVNNKSIYVSCDSVIIIDYLQYLIRLNK
jgi:hypothetical protein